MNKTMTKRVRLTMSLEEAQMVKFLLSYGLDKVQMKSKEVMMEVMMVQKMVYILENKIS